MVSKDGNEPPPSRAETTSNEGGDSIASLVITTFQSLDGSMQALAGNRN